MLITSVTNNKVKQWTKYKNKKYRDLDDRFMIEGMHLIEEAHKAKIIESIIILQGATILIHNMNITKYLIIALIYIMINSTDQHKEQCFIYQ